MSHIEHRDTRTSSRLARQEVAVHAQELLFGILNKIIMRLGATRTAAGLLEEWEGDVAACPLEGAVHLKTVALT